MCMAAAEPLVRYRFGRFELQPDERCLLESGKQVPLRPQAFDLLLVLVERAGHLLTKDELLNLVWRNVVVEENSLQAKISALRKVLGTDAITTVSGRGYRFIEPVEQCGRTGATGETSPLPECNLP